MSTIFEGQKTVKDILSSVKEIDREIDTLFESKSLYAIPFIPGVEFLLSKSFLKRRPIPKLLTTSYDYHILYFPQLGIIRSLRYMGQQDLASRQKFELSGMTFEADMLFEIKKLRIQRDAYSKLGKDLTGCFISYGQVNIEPLIIHYKLPVMKPLYSNMIKPSAAIQGNFHSILPTPFSSTSITTVDGKEKLLTACNLLLLIDYRKAREGFGYVLGERLNFIEGEAYAFACIHDEKQTEMFRFQVIGPFKIIIPKIERVDKRLYEEYFYRKDVVVSNVAVVIVMSNINVLLKTFKQDKDENEFRAGYILAFYEVPFNILPDAFLHFGELLSIANGGYSLECMKIKLNYNLLNLFWNVLLKTMDYVKKTFNTQESEVLNLSSISVLKGYAEKWMEQGWIEHSSEYLYLYAPTLVWFSIIFNIELSEVINMLSEVAREKPLRKLVFDERGMINHKKLELREKIRELGKYLYIWNKVFNAQRRLARIHKLYMLV